MQDLGETGSGWGVEKCSLELGGEEEGLGVSKSREGARPRRPRAVSSPPKRSQAQRGDSVPVKKVLSQGYLGQAL